MKPYDPHQLLRQCFGHKEFRPLQLEIITCLLNGKDVFALMPTGSGKSLCYQLAAILRNGVGIIISPLIALMQDQVAALRQIGVRASVINSSLSYGEIERTCKRVLDGGTDLLYVAPERLLSDVFQKFLERFDLALFAVDEAHCVSQWGHDFRPEYLKISEVTNKFQDVPCIALTATADSVTRKEILEKLNLKESKIFISSFDRPNILYKVIPKSDEKKQLVDFIKEKHPNDAGIVYTRTRDKSAKIAEWLTSNGLDALPYHAGLEQSVRLKHQKYFFENDGKIIVATIAFGMGIDKADVRFVAHLNLPSSMEAYYQETGRAGRDGKPADAWMIYSLSDVIAMRKLLESSAGDESFKRIRRKKLETLLTYCESTDCRRRFILNYFDEAHEGGCHWCDNCIVGVEAYDATVTAKKALSCAARTGQRFGSVHLSHILMGRLNKRVQQFKHEKLKNFGVGKDLSQKEWNAVFRQLLGIGLLTSDIGKVAGFRITEEGWKVLRNERNVMLRKDQNKFRENIASAYNISPFTVNEEPESYKESLEKRGDNKSGICEGDSGDKDKREDDFEKWKPDPLMAELIRNKIIQLGSISAVTDFYSTESKISRYARLSALKIFGKIATETRVDEPKEPSQISVKNTSKNVKHIICLASSRKYDGVCVAGKEILNDGSSVWIRPVSNKSTGELTDPEIRSISLLDIVSFTFKQHLLHNYQSENFLIADNPQWGRLGKYCRDQILNLCDTPNILWINGYHSQEGLNDRVPFGIANDTLNNSLYLIKPEEFAIEVVEKILHKPMIRADFRYKGFRYRFSITDPCIEKDFSEKGSGIYKFENKKIYLCISIGEPFYEFCYKLVAGVIII